MLRSFGLHPGHFHYYIMGVRVLLEFFGGMLLYCLLYVRSIQLVSDYKPSSLGFGSNVGIVSRILKFCFGVPPGPVWKLGYGLYCSIGLHSLYYIKSSSAHVQLGEDSDISYIDLKNAFLHLFLCCDPCPHPEHFLCWLGRSPLPCVL